MKKLSEDITTYSIDKIINNFGHSALMEAVLSNNEKCKQFKKKKI